MRERGGEYGTTTGRARRCGWLDLVALKYAVRINGLTGLVITKLDVLSGIDPLTSASRYPGPRAASSTTSPTTSRSLHKVDSDYVELPGWDEDIRGVPLDRRPPRERRRPTSTTSATSSAVPIVMVGVGPAASR